MDNNFDEVNPLFNPSNDKKYNDYLDAMSGNTLTTEQKDEVIKFLKLLAEASLHSIDKQEKAE